MTALTHKASRSILILYNSLPRDQREVWVTAAEIRNRLVLAGVRRELTEQHVVHAKMVCDRMDAFLVRRRDAKVSYFRSPEFEDKCPDDQRWKDSGLPDRKIAKSIMPTSIRDCFKSNSSTHKHLTTLNDALAHVASQATTVQLAQCRPWRKWYRMQCCWTGMNLLQRLPNLEQRKCNLY